MRITNKSPEVNHMGKHSIAGAVVGGIFTVLITWVAMADALEEGGFAIISTGIFGLAAGLCIGGLSQRILSCWPSKKGKKRKRPIASTQN
jgi:high-affinity Fe2+/Pb2+ permease